MDKIRYKTFHKKQQKISKVNYIPNGHKNNLQILRSTYLKDKKGHEIYENDIVHLDENHGMVKAGYYIVSYHNACFMITKDAHKNYMDHYLWFIADKCEVINNFLESKDEWTKLQIKSIKKQPQVFQK